MPTPSSRRRKARVTSSRNRAANKPSTPKPVSTGSPRARAARARVSTAKVSSASNGKPTGSASGRVTTGRAGAQSAAKQPSPQAQDAKRWQQLNQSKSAKAGKAAEPKPRTPAPGTGNVLQSAIDRSKALKDAARQANRSRVATRDAARASGAKGAVAALAGAAAEKVLGPVARKAGAALANRVLKPAARKLDDAMPGVNSKDEAKRRNAQAASKGSTSKFKGARDAAVKKASAIKGSPVVGPRKSSSGSASAAKQFDSAFAAARKAGKSTFTWRGKKYTTKVK